MAISKRRKRMAREQKLFASLEVSFEDPPLDSLKSFRAARRRAEKLRDASEKKKKVTPQPVLFSTVDD